MPAHSHLSDDERFPSIPRDARGLLERLREHPAAPRYNLACGDRLDANALARVTEFEAGLTWPVWLPGETPSWVETFARTMVESVPLYRRRGSFTIFEALPTTSRRDIAREPWSLVPDDAPLDDLIVYYTSGASGSPMDVLCHPDAASMRLPLLRLALGSAGVTLDGGADRVSILFVCSQQFTLTYASLSSYLGGAGHVKINLNPADWKDPGDRVRFLEEHPPEIYTGDPLSLMDLAALPITTRPKALVSSAMKLMPAVRSHLEERFGCPVIDLYSTCESGLIAMGNQKPETRKQNSDWFRVLPPDLFVEILDENGGRCAPGVRGEITLTGGRNRYLPLLRYRTGDFAALEFEEDAVYLTGLEGRAPVVFMASDGRAINNLDVTTLLRPFALSRFAVHQRADHSLLVRLPQLDQQNPIAVALRQQFGEAQEIDFALIGAEEWKVQNYSTDVD